MGGVDKANSLSGKAIGRGGPIILSRALYKTRFETLKVEFIPYVEGIPTM